MRIAEFRESLDFWTYLAPSGIPEGMSGLSVIYPYFARWSFVTDFRMKISLQWLGELVCQYVDLLVYYWRMKSYNAQLSLFAAPHQRLISI